MQQFVIMGSLGGGGSTYAGSGGFVDPSGVYPVSGYGPDMNQLSRGAAAASSALANLSGNVSPATTTDAFAAANPSQTLTQSQLDAAPWMKIALSQLGYSQQANPTIIQSYLRGVGLSNSSSATTPWCSAFCNYCMTQAGVNGSRSAAARSWLNWGKSIDFSIPSNISYGSVFVVSRLSSNPYSAHVGFFVKDNGNGWFQALNGNAGGGTGIVKYSNFQYSQLLGMRMPLASS
jgi:uncharacterized protein (TIGR02594 family)